MTFMVNNPGAVNPFPNKPWFSCVCRTSLLKTLWEKEKLLATSNFSFSHSVFYLFGELFVIFIKSEIVVCRLFQSARVFKVVVWERVKYKMLKLFTAKSRLFMTLGKNPLKKLWEKEKMLVTSIFSTLPKPNFTFLSTLILLSANSFNLHKSKILLFW